MKTNKKNHSGFTLIEVIIYIALFSLLMGTAFITAIQLIDGTNKINTQTTVAQEGNFVMRKLEWALTGLDQSNPPIVGGFLPCSQTLTTQKINYPNNPIVVRLNARKLEVNEAGGAYTALSTGNVSATCLQVRIIPALGTGPSGVTATTTINGVDFSVTKYIRK